jgi:glycosyltransferase involved in cell wall biosynthesis
LLLRAFSQVFRGKDVRLRIAGTGYEGAKLKRLKRLVAELGISNQVELLGMISQDGLLELIQSSHALVSSSKAETFAVTGIEAMSCGKPIVATRSGGPEYYVNKSNGILTKPGDVDAFANAMQYLVDHYDLYHPGEIRSGIEIRFSERAIVKQLEMIYQEVLEQNRP